MKKGYKQNIEALTLENDNFRKVLYTGEHMQLVLMTLKPLEEIGLETHTENDQFFRFEGGTGVAIVGETEYAVADGDSVIVPANTEHNIKNTSETDDLKLYTIYSPAHHADGIIRKTKSEAMENEAEFDGKTTE